MIINGIIIGISVIGIIVCFIVTSNFQGSGKKEPEGQLSIKKETTVEINEEIAKDVFFSKIENVDLDKIQIKARTCFKRDNYKRKCFLYCSKLC